MLHVHIKGNYGHVRLTKSQYRKKDRDGTLTPQERSDFNEPGPFSLVSYLEAFLDKVFYGDEITLVLISMMWQIRITVLQAETKMQTKIRHSNTLALADMVLVQTAHLHYFPVSSVDLAAILYPFAHVVPCWLWLCHFGFMCTMLGAYVPHWLCHITVCLSSPFLLPVKERVITSEDGESIIEWDLVKTAPLIKSLGHDLLNDDPGVYSDGEDFDGFCPDREWPNEELASQPAPVPISQSTQPPSSAFSASDS